MEGIKGYKVFESDWTCRGFQYAVGKTFEEDIIPSCCRRGFHFCKELKDCFSYYHFNPENKVAEIIALGEVDEEFVERKCCTNKIHIVQEITWEEVLRMVNVGKGNTGFTNSGNYNTGDWNTGDKNTGNYNSGYKNSGDNNSGNWNSGDYNSGDWNSCNYNSGNYNSGRSNSGNRNSGDWNTGDKNSGDKNTGYKNSGNYNTGDWNTGDKNTGNYNSGYKNSGDNNSGNWNSGDYNSGDWNKTNFSSGCFNTEEPKIVMFNKPSDWTYLDWLNSEARFILSGIHTELIEWIWSCDMTDEEKSAHPEHETTGGYLKLIDKPGTKQMWWDGLSDEEQNIVKAIPNFDRKIFKEITGVDVGE